jgi:Tol biopolymer transport system component
VTGFYRPTRSWGPHRTVRFALFLASLCLAVAPTAQATFPGPDGAIAFDSGFPDRDVLAMRPDGSEVRNFTRTCLLAESSPDWSPDGSRLAFGTTRTGAVGVGIIGWDGGSGTDQPAPIRGKPSWSPDGSRFVFQGGVGGGGYDIFLINADGSGLRNLTNTPTQNELDPAWSPDGSKIVFAAPGTGGQLLYTMDPSGANRTQLSQPASGSSSTLDSSPDWAPDGSRIAFSRLVYNGGSGIYVMPATGGSPTRLVAPINDQIPTSSSWSPSGTKIAFVGTGVWTMNADGSALKKINSTNTSSTGTVDWGSSPSYGGVAGRCVKEPKVKTFGQLRRLRNGVAWVLGCPAPVSLSTPRCSASLQLSPKPAKRRGRSARLVGRKKVSIPAGKRKKVVARLNAAGKRSLRRKGRLRLRVKAVVKYGKGALATRKTATRSIVLRAPRTHRSSRRTSSRRR